MSISTFLGSDLIPLRRRGIFQGIGNIAYGSGAMLGGVFGGLINDHTAWGWRLAFLVQVPPVLVSAVLVTVLVKVPPKASDKSYLARIDFGGVFLTISFLVLLLLGLNAGGNLVPWVHPLPLTTIPLSFLAFGAFLFWETKVKQPIIPVRLLANRTILSACLTNLLCTMVMMMALFYVPLYLQVTGLSATDAGLRILTSPLGVSIMSIGAGYIMKKTGKYVVPGICALVIFNTGIVILTQFDENTPAWVNYLVFFFVGGGYGAMLTITLLGCISAVDHSQQAVITSATCESIPTVFQYLSMLTNLRPGPQPRWHRRHHDRLRRLPKRAQKSSLGALRRLPQRSRDHRTHQGRPRRAQAPAPRLAARRHRLLHGSLPERLVHDAGHVACGSRLHFVDAAVRPPRNLGKTLRSRS